MSEWLYLRIYPGRFENLDLLIRAVVAPAARQRQHSPGVERWFFIRYLDARGPHLRLRYQVQAAAVAAWQQQLESLLQQALPAVAAATPAPARRLLPWPLPQAPVGPAGYELDLYEPEYDKYGGEAGTAIAEKLFEASSELALAALAAEAGTGAGRAPLALTLMAAAAAAFVPVPDQAAFWDHYGWYWSGGDRGAAAGLRASFQAAARRRAETVRQQCREIQALAAPEAWIAGYRQALEAAAAEVRAATLPVPPGELCFHYVHMMNNRLGILPGEEAYLAELVRSL